MKILSSLGAERSRIKTCVAERCMHTLDSTVDRDRVKVDQIGSPLRSDGYVSFPFTIVPSRPVDYYDQSSLLRGVVRTARPVVAAIAIVPANSDEPRRSSIADREALRASSTSQRAPSGQTM